MKQTKGITLVALVITIIILLILAGISIQAITNTGLFESASQAKKEAKRAQIVEWLNLKLMEEQMYNLTGTAEEIIEATRENIIEYQDELKTIGKEVTVEDTKTEEDGEQVEIYFYIQVDEDVYKVETAGAQFIGEAGKFPPVITLENITQTTNSITIKIKTTRNEDGKLEIYKKSEDDEKYTLEKTSTREEAKELEYTFSGLEQNKNYSIKIIATAKNGQTKELIKDVKLGSVPDLKKGDITFTYKVDGQEIDKDTWTNKSVTVTASTEITGYTLQTSKDGETWSNETTQTFTKNGQIYVALYDGKNYGGSASGNITNIDTTKPIVTGLTTTTSSISITGTDEASGIVEYVYSKTNTTPTKFEKCDSTLDLNITVENLDSNTKYYIWVKDAAGNISEYKTITTAIANYSINSGATYTTLAQTVENATVGDEIKVISDYTDTSDVIVNKNLKINTNGKTLTRTKTIEIANGITSEIAGSGTLTTAEEINLITNNGTLNITHEGTISNTNEGTSSAIYNLGTLNKTGTGIINNTGTKAAILEGNVNISNGKVTSTNSHGIFTSGIVNILDQAYVEGTDNAIFLVENATATISGGTLNASKYDGIYTGGNSKLTISGGTITGSNAAIYHDSTNIIEINGGNLAGTNLHGMTIAGQETGNVEINGGNISGKAQGIWKDSTGNLTINGGEIKATTDYDGISLNENNSGNLTITNGTIIGNNNGIWTRGKENITISGGTLKGNTYEGIEIYQKSSGTLTITGGSITGKECGIRANESTIPEINITNGTIIGEDYQGIHSCNSSNIKININGGNIQATHSAIFLDRGDQVTLNVLKGNLTCTLYDGISVYSNATVNIGDSTKIIDNNSLIISGGNFGMYKSADFTSTINYNNGTLKGTIAGYSGTMNIRSGYTVNTTTEGNYYVTTLK